MGPAREVRGRSEHGQNEEQRRREPIMVSAYRLVRRRTGLRGAQQFDVTATGAGESDGRMSFPKIIRRALVMVAAATVFALAAHTFRTSSQAAAAQMARAFLCWWSCLPLKAAPIARPRTGCSKSWMRINRFRAQQAIVISEHVTYWNHQGWRDPYSLDEVDMRQKEYGDRFNLDSVYTPQAVIDGTAQVVGNNGAALHESGGTCRAEPPKKALALGDAHWENGGVRFTVHGTPDADSKLIAVLVADASDQKVRARRKRRAHAASCRGGAGDEGIQLQRDGWAGPSAVWRGHLGTTRAPRMPGWWLSWWRRRRGG